jgi:hypothetical protein
VDFQRDIVEHRTGAGRIFHYDMVDFELDTTRVERAAVQGEQDIASYHHVGEILGGDILGIAGVDRLATAQDLHFM